MSFLLKSFQWSFYTLMGSIIIPVSVAHIYGFDSNVMIGFVSRSLFVIGIAGILQTLFGHKLPIIEGPAGIWWGVFILYAGIGPVLFGSQEKTLQVMEFSFILSGVIFITMSLLGIVERLAKLFTPTVMGTYLVLLVLQLSGPFFRGMFGITTSSPSISPMVAILSLATVVIAYICVRFKSVASYATLISIVLGWLLFYLFGQANPVTLVDKLIYIPKVFAFGRPKIETGMILNVGLLTTLLLTNLMVSVRVVQAVFAKFNQPTENRLNQTAMMSGIIHILAGTFGAIGPVPISGSAAFIQQTRIFEKLPFIIGNALIILISLSPYCTSFFAALPPAVGYAALIPSFGIGTIIIAINQLEIAGDKSIRNLCVAAGWFVGVGIMFMPAAAFSGLSPLFTSLMSNGLIVGTVMVVSLEQILMRRRNKAVAAE